jgi:methylmalonyl-CoA epimerase
MRIESLDHVALAVADRVRAEGFFGRTLGLERDSSGRYRIGRTAFELLDAPPEGASGGSREGIVHLALGVSDLESVPRELARVDLPTGPPGACPSAPSSVWLDPDGTAGVPLCLVKRAPADGSSAVGADGLIERIDHVGVASTDNAGTRELFAGQFGLAVESSQTDTEVRIPAEFFVSDKYGVAFNTRPAEAVGGLRVTFFTLGDCELEVLQDIDPTTAVERAAAEAGTRRDQSAISRFVQKRGPGLHHIALKVRDLDAMLRRLEADDVTLIDHRGRPGSRRAQIAFLHPKSTHGVLFHLVQRDEVPT